MAWADLASDVAEVFTELRDDTRQRYEQRCFNRYKHAQRRRAEAARERTEVARLYRWRWRFPVPPLAHACVCGERFASAYGLRCHGYRCKGAA